MTRIAIAGFQHETNTFGATRASFREFEIADSWPPLLRGDAVFEGVAGINLPIEGAIRAARAAGDIDLVPLLWCAAEPSSFVTDDAFERISGMICDGLAAAGHLDGVYLDLHGAMVTESHQDGEGALLRRIRATVGPDLPVAVSLDLHANLTAAMVDHASVITIFRTYPHIDMDTTGARAMALLRRLVATGPLSKAYGQVPYLLPLSSQYTEHQPCKGLYAMLEGPAMAGAVTADIAMGFPAADIHDAGMAAVAYGAAQAEADAALAAILARFDRAEAEFDNPLLSAEAAVARAMAYSGPGPVVIADAQDNPGAGGTADTTGLLAALVTGGAEGAVLGMLDDPAAVRAALAAGEGGTFAFALGGKSGLPGLGPFEGRFRVLALHDGRFEFTGEMYRGAVAEVGPTALLQVLDTGADVRVVVGSKRCQALDQAVFSHLGVDPAAQRIVAVKSTVHYRADFDPIAGLVLTAEAPGTNLCRLDRVPYRNLRPGVRLGPGGCPFEPIA